MAKDAAIAPGEIRDFLRDALPADRMAAIERLARDDSKVMDLIAAEREAMNRGDHSLGAIWQENQVSCPSREQLGGYLIQAGDPDYHTYVTFHLTVIECAICQSNLEDLKSQTAAKKSKHDVAGKPKRKR